MTAPVERGNGVEFRDGRTQDASAIASLLYHSFPDPSVPLEARERRLREHSRGRPDQFLIAERDGRAVACARSLPFATRVGGTIQPLLGVASVAVDPGERRRGTAKALVTEAMRRARAQGVALAALYPFRHGFYASIGYAHAVEQRHYDLKPGDLPLYAERERVRRGTDDDVRAMVACYGRVAERSTLMLERDEAYFRWVTLHDNAAFTAVAESDAGVAGYMVLEYLWRDDRPPSLRVEEVVYEDEAALRGLLGYVASLADQFEEAAILLPESARLELRLANPRAHGAWGGSITALFGARIRLGAMARVLDVTRALRARPSYNDASGQFRLTVTDDQIPENAWPLDVTLDGGALDVTEAEAPGNALPSVIVPVGAFTLMYLGAVAASGARELGLLEADDDTVALLDTAFASSRPALLDVF